MVDYKGRVESYSREVLRKESQIKELQGRIDTGDGCEYSALTFSKLLLSLFLSFSAILLAISTPPQPSMPSSRS